MRACAVLASQLLASYSYWLTAVDRPAGEERNGGSERVRLVTSRVQFVTWAVFFFEGVTWAAVAHIPTVRWSAQ